MIRPATPADAEGFHRLARLYIAESGQGRQYSARHTQAAFEHALADEHCALLVAGGSHGGLAAGTIVALDYAFTADPVGIVTMFYVASPYRGTPLARTLLDAAVTWADNCGCSHVFTSASGMLPGDATQQFVNLCRKYGFTECGPVLARRKP